MKDSLFLNRIRDVGLDDLSNWFGDPRGRLIDLFMPLIENSSYRIEKNLKDKTAPILELYRTGNPRRIMGFALHPKKQEVGAFFNKGFYDSLRRYMVLPDNQRKGKTQPHVTVELETIWIVLRIATEIIG